MVLGAAAGFAIDPKRGSVGAAIFVNKHGTTLLQIASCFVQILKAQTFTEIFHCDIGTVRCQNPFDCTIANSCDVTHAMTERLGKPVWKTIAL